MILMPYTILNLKFLKCNTTDRGLTGDAFECHRTRAASPGLRREESGWTKMSSSSCSCSSRIVVVVVAAAVVVVAAWQHSSSSSSISSSGGAVQSCSHGTHFHDARWCHCQKTILVDSSHDEIGCGGHTAHRTLHNLPADAMILGVGVQTTTQPTDS